MSEDSVAKLREAQRKAVRIPLKAGADAIRLFLAEIRTTVNAPSICSSDDGGLSAGQSAIEMKYIVSGCQRGAFVVGAGVEVECGHSNVRTSPDMSE